MPNNRKPGVLFIGMNDDGSFSGCDITDDLLRSLSDMRSDGNITPFPSIVVQKTTLRGHEIAVAIVEPSESPPVRYKGRVWIRVGPRRAVATPEEERRLTEKRRSGDRPFDIRPVASASFSDIDEDLFFHSYLPAALPAEAIEMNQRSTIEQLQSLRFATVSPDPVPTVVGILSVGKDPREFLPGAYVQFLRIDGTELTDPLKDQKEIAGPIPELLRRLDDVFHVHISVASDLRSQPVEARLPDYPIVALQQLARNAILHRNYEGTNAPTRIHWFSDRLEILSPGGPFGQVTKENFGTPGVTDYRNPHLAEVMKNFGFVQRFGIGIRLARQELDKNGNPPPEFLVEDSRLLAIVRQRQ
jgi:ATP-dependent DNA helicase RecG